MPENAVSERRPREDPGAPVVGLIEPEDAAAYAGLTYPAMRHLVEAPPADRDMVLAGAEADGEPVGLAFAMGGPNGEYELVSLHVAALCRGRGLGRALLALVEQVLAARGYRLGVHFFTVDADDAAYARFLVAAGWSRPRLRQIVCRTDLERAFATPWLVRARLPKGFSIVAWHELSEAERAGIRARKAVEPGFYTALLDPFAHEAGCEPETSLALLRGGEAVGWMITHALDDCTLRWTISHVARELQGVGGILPLWWQAVQRQRSLTARSRFIWTVPVEEPRMVRFALRRMRPWLASLGCACVSVKPVG